MIRTGKLTDVAALDAIARRVANELHASGVDQWSATYPGVKEFSSDALRGALYVDEEEGVIAGSMSLLPENDPAYVAVSWVGSHALVMHRVMVDPIFRRQGIGASLFAFAIEQAKAAGADSLKVDTHPDNRRMRNLIEKFGFVHRGHLPLIYREGYELPLR
jgi:GNAT superfamily N-acetyltransferase